MRILRSRYVQGTALFLILVAATNVASCRDNATATQLPTMPRSMKGYELYSWYADGDWCFALVTATNRIKTYGEITAPGIRVEGLDAVSQELERLARGEQLFWSAGRVPGTTLPPASIVDSVRDRCRGLGIELQIVDKA